MQDLEALMDGNPSISGILNDNGDSGNNNNNNSGDVAGMAAVENYDVEAHPPLGWRFSPNDVEVIYYYLKNKVENRPLPPVNISEVDVYKFNPQDLSETYPPNCNRLKEWYFFTPRDRKYKNGKRPNRRAGDGFWKATGADKEVKMNGEVIGWKRALVFYYGKPPKGEKTSWIMHEYMLKHAPSSTIITTTDQDDMKLDVCVLCKIYQNTKKSDTPQENHTSRNQSQNQSSWSHRYLQQPGVQVTSQNSSLEHQNQSLPLGVQERTGNSNFQNQASSSHQNMQQPGGQLMSQSGFLMQQNQSSFSQQCPQLGGQAWSETNFQNQFSSSHQYVQLGGQVTSENNFQNQAALCHQLQLRDQARRDDSFLQQQQQITDMPVSYSSMMTNYNDQMPDPMIQSTYLDPTPLAVAFPAYEQNNYVNNAMVPSNSEDVNMLLPEFPGSYSAPTYYGDNGVLFQFPGAGSVFDPHQL